ncbi:hypothetical protein V6N13_113922 [Hibiscus sabdariffa]
MRKSNSLEFDIEAGNEETFHRPSNAEVVERDEEDLVWEALARLPSVKQGRFAILRRTPSEIEHAGGVETASTETIDVTKLDRARRELVVKKALATNDQDNFKLLSAIKDRLDRVGLEVRKVEVRFQNLNIEAKVRIGSRALPTLINVARDFFEDILTGLGILRANKSRLHILKEISGVVRPGRMTLLLGPPGSGKSTLLLALAGKLDNKALKVSGDITYNGTKLDEFYVRRTSAYISQTDNHIPELTVRETLDFAARCQGASEGMAEYMKELTKLEKEKNIRPAPEIDAFMKMVYQGPREGVLEFFESLGFKLPPRKGVADFLQEVTSKKDQAQYWSDPSKPYMFIPVSEMATAFKNSRFGKSMDSTLSVPYDKSRSHPSALSKTKYAASRWELLNSCFSREILLITRHRFLYIFRTLQVAFVAFITGTIFLRTRIHPTDEINGNLYISALFFGVVHMMFNGFSELPLMIIRLPVFYKQRDNLFHPAWIWSVVSFILRLPYSVVEAVVWSCVVYYTIGFAPSVGRFFRFMFVKFVVHQTAIGLFRMLAAVARDIVIANTFGSAAILVVLLLGGFLVPKDHIKPWWAWASWLSPLQYAQRAVSINEFTATRWKKMSAMGSNTVGYNVLRAHGLPYAEYWYWLGVAVLLLYALLFNLIVTLALIYLNPITKAPTVIPDDTENSSVANDVGKEKLKSDAPSAEGSSKKGMILPFQPLAMTFQNVNYFVDMPKLLLLKRGGRIIYGGKLGVNSQILIDYFQSIDGVPSIRDGYNPATWMLEVTNPAVEQRLDIDFADIYKNSAQYREVEGSIARLSVPAPGSKVLKFPSTYSQGRLSQFLICLKKQNIVYWRSPCYNLVRLVFTSVCALIFGSVFWDVGDKRNTIKGWWMWFYHICPIAWTLKGIISSQLGDVETMIIDPTFKGTVKEYISTVFGIHGGLIGPSVLVLIGFCVLFFGVFTLSVQFLNFQKR